MSNLAYFLFRPKRISDLEEVHLVETEKPFHIIWDIKLSFIDYENFSEDLLADRAFWDWFVGPQKIDGVYQCIFVHRWNKSDGILVVPKDGFVCFAARYIPLHAYEEMIAHNSDS